MAGLFHYGLRFGRFPTSNLRRANACKRMGRAENIFSFGEQFIKYRKRGFGFSAMARILLARSDGGFDEPISESITLLKRSVISAKSLVRLRIRSMEESEPCVMPSP